MLNDNTQAGNAEECLNQCNISPDCNFWDFGDNYCRLLSYNVSGPEVAGSHISGRKYCTFGTYFLIKIYLDIEIFSCSKYITKFMGNHLFINFIKRGGPVSANRKQSLH